MLVLLCNIVLFSVLFSFFLSVLENHCVNSTGIYNYLLLIKLLLQAENVINCTINQIYLIVLLYWSYHYKTIYFDSLPSVYESC